MRKRKSVKVIPLGGLGEIGKNITAIEYEDEIIVIDCGISFPDEDMYGVDLVIPDVAYLIENKDKVKRYEKFEDTSYQAYFSSDVTASYQATEFVNVFALAGAEYRNWAVSNASSATNWRWQPYVAAGFNVAF